MTSIGCALPLRLPLAVNTAHFPAGIVWLC